MLYMREAALAKAKKEYDAPPCPNCGAESEVTWPETSTYDEWSFVPGLHECSARCFEDDPDGYLDAVRSRKK